MNLDPDTCLRYIKFWRGRSGPGFPKEKTKFKKYKNKYWGGAVVPATTPKTCGPTPQKQLKNHIFF